MGLMRIFIKSDLPDFIANGVRLKILGDYKRFEPDIVGDARRCAGADRGQQPHDARGRAQLRRRSR